MRARNLIFPLILFIALPFSITAQSSESGAIDLYSRVQRDYFELKNDEVRIQNPNAWQRIISRYSLIIDSYPNDPIVDDITFITGTVYREMYQLFGKREYLDKAVEKYRTVLRDYPDSYLQQAALFAVGELQETHIKAPSQALKSYQELVTRFPKGYKTAAARDRIAALNKELNPDAGQPADEPTGPGSAQVETETAIDASADQPSLETSITEQPLAEESPDAGIEPEESLSEATYTSSDGKSAVITDIRTSFGRNTGRVVIELSGEISYYYKKLLPPNPRIYFDLKNVNLSRSKLSSHTIDIENTYLERIRIAQFSRSVTRVVLDFSEFRGYKVFHLPGPGDHFRIVFDLYGAGKGPAFVSAGNGRTGTSGTGNTTRIEPLGDGAEKNRTGNYSISRQLGAKIRTVVIDPGHGGKDPGAIGFSNLTEKKLNLDIALRVKKLFETEYPEVQVKLTREADSFVALDQRPALSKVAEGDLFVSLHSNATRRGRSSGIETYYLNFAYDAESAELAAKENALSRFSQAKLEDLVKQITTNNKMEESRELAHFIQKHLYQQTKPVNPSARNLGVKHAPFVVLIGTSVPSALVEMGFINHQIEGKLLLQYNYKDRIARGLFNGIKAYIESLK